MTAIETSKLVVDIGVFKSETLATEVSDDVTRAAQMLADELNAALPHYAFRITFRDLEPGDSSPAALGKLEQAVATLDREQLDFALFALAGELRGPGGAPLLGVSSQLFGCAVYSPETLTGTGQRSARLKRLMLRLIAALNGIAASAMPAQKDDWTHSDLAKRLSASLSDVADQRLEEQLTRRRRWQFYVRGAWLNRRELLQALWRTRPWLFPLRLSRLMAGGVSASTLIMFTAEAWELALAQKWAQLAAVAVASQGLAVAYLLQRQRLLSHLKKRALTERRVTAEIVGFIGVSWGMLSTFVSLFAIALLIGVGVYPVTVIEGWASVPVTGESYAKMACLAGTVGMVVGALGASLEPPSSFRYSLLVDEEIEPGE